jgi:hypothetical protein
MSDTDQSLVGAAMGIVAILLALSFALAIYVFYCFCCKKICEKSGVIPGVMIWIPIVNLVPLLQVAKMPVWMIVLFFIPLANLVVAVMMWAKICAARGKSEWLVILMFVPLVNLAFVPYLAFAD